LKFSAVLNSKMKIKRAHPIFIDPQYW
jgi:hypothetical protein